MTLIEACFPNTPEFAEVQRILSEAVVAQMLTLVWTAWDYVHQNMLRGIDLSVSDEQLERNLNSQLEMAIQDRLTHSEPYQVQHESYEMESSAGRRRPLQYDIAFILRALPRVQWPIEGKVLPTEKHVSDYVGDIKNAFVTCDYAPFTGEGAMVGYLRAGRTDDAFAEIALRFKRVALRRYHALPQRPHRISLHRRRVPRGKKYPRQLRCHHLLFALSKAASQAP